MCKRCRCSSPHDGESELSVRCRPSLVSPSGCLYGIKRTYQCEVQSASLWIVEWSWNFVYEPTRTTTVWWESRYDGITVSWCDWCVAPNTTTIGIRRGEWNVMMHLNRLNVSRQRQGIESVWPFVMFVMNGIVKRLSPCNEVHLGIKYNYV